MKHKIRMWLHRQKTKVKMLGTRAKICWMILRGKKEILRPDFSSFRRHEYQKAYHLHVTMRTPWGQELCYAMLLEEHFIKNLLK